jgi:phosphotriesterase-related protein
MHIGLNRRRFKLACLIASLLVTAKDIAAADVQYMGVNIPDNSGKVMTVRGAISPGLLGPTLMHEHLFLEFWLPLDEPERWQQFYKQSPPSTKEEIDVWNQPFVVADRSVSRLSKDITSLSSVEDAVDEVKAYQKLGGKTLVDLTSIGLNRQPEKLMEVAERTGAHIVASTGYYSQVFHPKNMNDRSIETLTLQMVRDIGKGIGDSGVQAGIIGEIPIQDMVFEPVESNEVRVLRAVARASQLTGASISFHSVFYEKKERLHIALDILEEEGADLSRVIMGHATAAGGKSTDIGFLVSLLDRGVYLQFDYLGLQSPYNPMADM